MSTRANEPFLALFSSIGTAAKVHKDNSHGLLREVNHKPARMGWAKSTGLLVTERQGYYSPVKCGLRILQAQDLKCFSSYHSTPQTNAAPVTVEERPQQKLNGMACFLSLSPTKKQYDIWSGPRCCHTNDKLKYMRLVTYTPPFRSEVQESGTHSSLQP